MGAFVRRGERLVGELWRPCAVWQGEGRCHGVAPVEGLVVEAPQGRER